MQSSPGRTLCGAFGGDADFEGGSTWLTDAEGQRHTVRYPEGWEVRFEPDAVLIGPTGEPYARSGDRICVWGSEADGATFEAASVEPQFRRRND